MKYDHLYRHAPQIATLADRHREADSYRQAFNHVRPHEARPTLPRSEGQR